MRIEYKFLVPMNRLVLLRNAIENFTKRDSYHLGNNDYTVRSIYFDTANLKFYHEKIDGIKERKKLRIRAYNQLSEDSIIFLEIKRKNENYISKNRSPLYLNDLSNLFASKDLSSYIIETEDYERAIKDGQMFFHYMSKMKLHPIVLIVYEREAYFSKFTDELRITFDKNLRYMLFPYIQDFGNETQMKYILPSHFILEVKFSGGLPHWLHKIISELNLSRLALSKYTMCLENEKKSYHRTSDRIFGLGKQIDIFSSEQEKICYRN